MFQTTKLIIYLVSLLFALVFRKTLINHKTIGAWYYVKDKKSLKLPYYTRRFRFALLNGIVLLSFIYTVNFLNAILLYSTIFLLRIFPPL